jgi:hypothetical protein
VPPDPGRIVGQQWLHRSVPSASASISGSVGPGGARSGFAGRCRRHPACPDARRRDDTCRPGRGSLPPRRCGGRRPRAAGPVGSGNELHGSSAAGGLSYGCRRVPGRVRWRRRDRGAGR